MMKLTILKWNVALQNYIEVPRSYHKQWAPHYPAYVKIEYNGAPHIIKVRKNGQQYYLADGLKQFRRNFNIHEGVLVRFVSPDNYFCFI